MKKSILLFCFLGSFFYNTDAQVVWSRFKFGIQGSPTFSWLKTDDQKIGGNGFNLGMKLGATADYYFLENYALSTGIGFGFNHGGKLFHEIGGNFLSNSTLSDNRYNNPGQKKPLPDKTNIRYSIQYVEVPLALKMRTQQFGYLRGFAQAPILTVGVRSQARGTITAEQINLKKENIKKDVNPIAIAWGFGGGVEYDISPSTALVAGLYFSRNFLDVTRDKDNYSIEELAAGQFAAPVPEKSKAVLNAVTLRLGIIF